ncbi:sigma-70, region 4 [Streptococcus agalactiae]|nr:sigma-70, region 4 [Streptococcus agalactiae]
MPMCRSPPFLSKNADKKRNGGNKMPKEYYLYVNGQRVKVSEQIYKVYWREKEHEKYLEQVDKKNHLLFFSSLDHDGHFVNNIVDESVDVEKIVEAQMMIEAVRNAISRLNAEERDVIERLYFNDETLSSVATEKKVSYQAIQWRKNNILKKLKKLLEELLD